MSLQKRFALSVALAALLSLTAAGASAATVNATFTLPAQAYWNNTLLQPGDYTLSMGRNSAGLEIVRLRGEGIAATFLAPSGPEASSGHSFLKVDAVNGTYVIREFDAGPFGGSYTFGVSNAARNPTMRGAASQPVSIPVSPSTGS
jgi:hypothetical protein